MQNIIIQKRETSLNKEKNKIFRISANGLSRGSLQDEGSLSLKELNIDFNCRVFPNACYYEENFARVCATIIKSTDTTSVLLILIIVEHEDILIESEVKFLPEFSMDKDTTNVPLMFNPIELFRKRACNKKYFQEECDNPTFHSERSLSPKEYNAKIESIFREKQLFLLREGFAVSCGLTSDYPLSKKDYITRSNFMRNRIRLLLSLEINELINSNFNFANNSAKPIKWRVPIIPFDSIAALALKANKVDKSNPKLLESMNKLIDSYTLPWFYITILLGSRTDGARFSIPSAVAKTTEMFRSIIADYSLPKKEILRNSKLDSYEEEEENSESSLDSYETEDVLWSLD